MGNTPRIDTVNPPWKIKRIVREAKTTKNVVLDAIIRGELHEVGPPGSGEIDPWEAAEWCAKRWRDAGAPVGPVGPVTEAAPAAPPAAPPPAAPAGPRFVEVAPGKKAAVAWEATSYPQEVFLRGGLYPEEGDLPDIFYGGARGGGKTDVCLGDMASRAIDFGNKFKSIIFRKSYDNLQEVKTRSQQFFPQLGFKFNESLYIWKHSNGALCYLRYMDKDSDFEAYLGWSVTALYFDELPLWPDPKPIDKLWSILRSPDGISCIRRSTGNPGGPGMIWVRERYRLGKDVCRPFEPFWYTPMPIERPNLRIRACYIPARLEDNPYLMQDPSYEMRLAASAGSENLFRAWRLGDWESLEGAYFASWNPEEHIYGTYFPNAPTAQPLVGGRGRVRNGTKDPEPVAPVARGYDVDLKPWFTRFLSIDWGMRHDAACLWFCWDGERLYIYREFVMSGLTPMQLAEAIVKHNDGDKISSIVVGRDAFEKRTSDKTIAGMMGEVFEANGMPFPQRAQDRSRVQGWMAMGEAIRKRTLRIHRSCRKLIESIPLAMHDPDKPEDVLKMSGDDALEACRNGIRENPANGQRPGALVVDEAYNEAFKKSGGDMHSSMMAAFMADRRQKMAELNQMLGLDMRGRRPRS